MRPISSKREEEIIQEWDRIARQRVQQIQSGEDISYHSILLPCISDLSSNSNFDSVIDIGCGVGFATEQLLKRAHRLVAIDFSSENIKITGERLNHYPNLSLINSSIEQFADTQPPNIFTLAVANMMLMTALSLDNVIHSIARLLQKGGDFVFTITHPRFWPEYWGYADADWFNYSDEIIIEAPFIISLQSDKNFPTTHIHRPWDQYVDILHKYDFVIDTIVEPMPAEEHRSLYPRQWKFPRFLGARCIKGK